MDVRKYRAAFVADARENLGLLGASLAALAKNPGDAQALGGVRRAYHTLRSTSATMSYPALSAACATEELQAKNLLESGQPVSQRQLEMWNASLRLLEAEIKTIDVP